jgi:hypothetical protein
VKLYLDSCALVKLIQREAESSALRRCLRRRRDDRRVTSALARVEVVRAVAGGPNAIAHARRQLTRVDQVALDRDLLDAAATLTPSERLRSLDAIHLASAHALAADLRAMVTYDERMATAGLALGMMSEAPA